MPQRFRDETVSIPLISGHQSGQTEEVEEAPKAVSIPLISGHQSGLIHKGNIMKTYSLNPFDIRASVRTARKCHNRPG